MFELRQRMMADMKLHGLASGTQKIYLNSVKRLADHDRRSAGHAFEMHYTGSIEFSAQSTSESCKRSVSGDKTPSTRKGLYNKTSIVEPFQDSCDPLALSPRVARQSR